MIQGDNNDSICAISTPHGAGGIAVIRVSGQRAIEIVNKVWDGKNLADVRSHTAHLGEILDQNGSTADQCVATVFLAPASYTGENTVELSIHGSKWVQRECLRILQQAGCRLAEPGEFTRRAVMNGRMDLTQAESVADLIASRSRAAHRLALKQLKGNISKKISDLREKLIHLSCLLELELDFSEEDVTFADRSELIKIANDIKDEISRLYISYKQGNVIKDGIPVAIVGNTNVGKSSLLNALLDDDRAIVSDIHGTTRDTIEEATEIGDYLFRFIDTAGIRDTQDPIEIIGIKRSMNALKKAETIILLLDSSQTESSISFMKSLDLSGIEYADIIIGINKTDLIQKSEVKNFTNKISSTIPDAAKASIIELSVLNGKGIEELKNRLTEIASSKENGGQGEILISNLRQAEALKEALDTTTSLLSGLTDRLETDLIAQHLRETIESLSSITGDIPSTEILQKIFSSFCIGK